MSPDDRLEGLAPLEAGLAFAAMCMVEIIDQLEDAFEAKDTEAIDKYYRLFEIYTGKLGRINDNLTRLLDANLKVVERRWSLGGNGVSRSED